jgi:2-polyprenyl-3-methyl-5-hydroxy-6-metoxy-1,4-benzoquinol methylase
VRREYFRRNGALTLHDDIWRALPEQRPASETHDHVLRMLETRLHDAGRGQGRLLDVGCGDGALAARLAGQGALVKGVDPSPAAIERARGAHPDMEWALPAGDGRLSAPDASFDVVTCVNVLEHVADTQSLLSELRRVLVSDGVLLVAVPFHGRLQAALTALTSFERHFDPLEPLLRFYTAVSLRRVLRQFAFEQVETAARGGMPCFRHALIALGRRAGI